MTDQHRWYRPPSEVADLKRVLPTLFTSRTVVVVANVDMYAGLLAESERTGTERMVESRLGEFTAGRVCARQALASLGVPVTGLPRDADRVPQWPPGVVGSISHCDGLCVAVVARTSDCGAIGIDVEPATRLDGDLCESVCCPAEQEHFRGLPHSSGADWPKVAFSLKESFYKAWFPITRRSLDFLEVELTLDPVERSARFSILQDGDFTSWSTNARGRFEMIGEHLVTGVAMPGDQSTGP